LFLISSGHTDDGVVGVTRRGKKRGRHAVVNLTDDDGFGCKKPAAGPAVWWPLSLLRLMKVSVFVDAIRDSSINFVAGGVSIIVGRYAGADCTCGPCLVQVWPLVKGFTIALSGLVVFVVVAFLLRTDEWRQVKDHKLRAG
jgi:hypothetical protein